MLSRTNLYPIARSAASKTGKTQVVFIASYYETKDADGLFTEPSTINCWMPAEIGSVLKSGTPVDGLININGDFIGLREFNLNGKTYKVTKTDDSNVPTVELPFEEPATTGSIKKA